MNIYIIISIILANAIAIGITYQFIKRLDNKQKLIIMAVSIASMYILISITYWFSGFDIDENIHKQTKDFIIYLFVPVNMILFVPYIASQYMKLKENKIKQDKFLKRLIVTSILLIIVLVIEYFYFCDVQNNIHFIGTFNEQGNVEQNMVITNEIENTITENVINNDIFENEITNQLD